MNPYIIGINGSPYKDGGIMALLKAVLDGAHAAGADIEMIHLYDLTIKPTPGLYSRDPALETPENMPEDDMKPLYEKILRADGMVFASPSYWGTMSAEMKKFIERLTPLTNTGARLMGKVAAFVAHSKENAGGVETAALDMAKCLLQMGVIITPYSVLWYPSNDPSAMIKEEAWAFADAPHVGRNMVRLINLLKEHPIHWFTESRAEEY